MSTTVIKLDESDIDTKGDKVHGFLMGEILIAAILASGAVKKENPADPDDKLFGLRGLIAEFLNRAVEQGITITVKE